ncbi:MAG: hypothetical protein RBS55_11255 [Bacteroidales bacterium]|jgi:hypothetical protein|nr:hypothetical protein [Bacteroidales bacterium]
MKIKNLFLISFSVLVMMNVTSGQTSRSLDEDIDRLTGKIVQYPAREKYLTELKSTYDEACRIDRDRIHELRAGGQPDIWYEIFRNYQMLENRQAVVKRIPDASLQKAGIAFADYSKELEEAKYKATAYLYAHAQKLLETGSVPDARQAYAELMKAASLNNSYKEIDKQIRKAVLKGASDVEFEMDNRTGKVVSSSMIRYLSVIVWEFKKANYDHEKPGKPDKSFPFTLRVVLEELQIGKDQVRDLQYQEERDVMRDFMIVDTIRCQISETRQLKKAVLSGRLEYIDRRTGQVVNRVPVKVESVFTNAYATLQGNPDAAGDETRRLLKSSRVAYPSNEQMILDATEEFAKKATEIIVGE